MNITQYIQNKERSKAIRTVYNANEQTTTNINKTRNWVARGYRIIILIVFIQCVINQLTRWLFFFIYNIIFFIFFILILLWFLPSEPHHIICRQSWTTFLQSSISRSLKSFSRTWIYLFRGIPWNLIPWGFHSSTILKLSSSPLLIIQLSNCSLRPLIKPVTSAKYTTSYS